MAISAAWEKAFKAASVATLRAWATDCKKRESRHAIWVDHYRKLRAAVEQELLERKESKP